MIAIVAIAIAAGCRLGADVRLDHFGRADLACPVLSRAAAADGGGDRMGTAQRRHRRHRRQHRRSACCSACPIASPMRSRSRCRPGGSAISRCWAGRSTMPRAGNGAAPVAPAMEWYPTGRLLLWIAGFAVLTTTAALLTLGGDATTIAATMKRGLLRILGPRASVADRRARTIDRRAGGDRAVRCRHRHHDDADPQFVARREDHQDVRPAAARLARSENHGVAADDAGRRCASRSPSASPADCWRCLPRSPRRRC